MLKRPFALVTAFCVAGVLGVLAPAVAAAAPAPGAAGDVSASASHDVRQDQSRAKVATRSGALPATAATAAASPVCSGTEGWGKIKYQTCLRYNCDSLNCYSRGYLGLINTATSSRTVNWILYTSTAPDGTNPVLDDRDTVTLAAGQQQTILSAETYHTICGIWVTEWLTVQYDSAGWSPAIAVQTFMPCV